MSSTSRDSAAPCIHHFLYIEKVLRTLRPAPGPWQRRQRNSGDYAVEVRKGKDPQGNDLQPYGERCVSQRMADYISCIESTGGGQARLREIVKSSSNVGGGLDVRVKPPVPKIDVGVGLNAKQEKDIVHVIERESFPGALEACKFDDDEKPGSAPPLLCRESDYWLFLSKYKTLGWSSALNSSPPATPAGGNIICLKLSDSSRRIGDIARQIRDHEDYLKGEQDVRDTAYGAGLYDMLQQEQSLLDRRLAVLRRAANSD